MSELKPCPFCGSSVYLDKIPMWNEHNGITHGYHGCYEFDVHCRNPKCGCTIKLTKNDTIYNSEDEARRNAIRAWNRRHIETFQNICHKCSKQYFCGSRTDETIGCSAFSSYFNDNNERTDCSHSDCYYYSNPESDICGRCTSKNRKE